MKETEECPIAKELMPFAVPFYMAPEKMQKKFWSPIFNKFRIMFAIHKEHGWFAILLRSNGLPMVFWNEGDFFSSHFDKKDEDYSENFYIRIGCLKYEKQIEGD